MYVDRVLNISICCPEYKHNSDGISKVYHPFYFSTLYALSGRPIEVFNFSNCISGL